MSVKTKRRNLRKKTNILLITNGAVQREEKRVQKVIDKFSDEWIDLYFINPMWNPAPIKRSVRKR